MPEERQPIRYTLDADVAGRVFNLQDATCDAMNLIFGAHRATDPRATPEELRRLAARYPKWHRVIMANPATPPDLRAQLARDCVPTTAA